MRRHSACAANTYQPSGTSVSTTCIPCRAGAVTPPGVTAVADAADCLCKPGHWTKPDGSCEAAPPARAASADCPHSSNAHTLL